MTKENNKPVCMCRELMENHNEGSGHTAVEMEEYYIYQENCKKQEEEEEWNRLMWEEYAKNFGLY